MFSNEKQKHLKIFILPLMFCAALLAMSACAGQKQVTPKQADVYGAGDVFDVEGNGFLLDEIVFMPEYDSDTHTGYGVIFLSEKSESVISFSADSIGGTVANPVSLIDMKLYDGEQTLKSTDIVLADIEDNPNYKAKTIFVFRIETRKELPKCGNLIYKDIGKDELSFEIDLSGLAISKTIGSKGAPAPAAETAAEPVAKSSVPPQNTDDEVLNEFSEPQEYEGEIPFEGSENVVIRFYLTADAKKITQIDLSMDDLLLEPKNSSSNISSVNITNAAMSSTRELEVTDGRISSEAFFIFDLAVTDSCIYGMINIEMEQEGNIMVNIPVYTVIPNITTPKEISADILRQE